MDIMEELYRKQHSTTDIQELMIDSNHLKDQQDIVDACNNYFSSIIDKISKNNVDNLINDGIFSSFHYYLKQNLLHPSSSLVLKTFSTKEITSTIKSLKTKNSQGYDEISNKLLTICANYIRSPSIIIRSKSILSGIFSDRLKFSIIKAIYKKGDRMNPTNHRSISLLTYFLKVIEKVLYIRVTEHFYSTK